MSDETPQTPKETPVVPEVKETPAPATPPIPSPGPKNVAWDEVFKFFNTAVDGRYPSLIETAGKFDISISTVEKRSAREKWGQKRSDSVGKAQEEFLKDKENQIRDANARHLKRWRKAQSLAGSLFKMIETRVGNYRVAQIKIERLKTGTDEEKKEITETVEDLKKIKLPSEHKLLSVVNILKTAIEGERIVLGLPIIVSKSDVTSEGEKVFLPPELIAEIDALARKNEQPKSPDSGSN